MSAPHTAPEAAADGTLLVNVDQALVDRMRAAVERLEALAAEIIADLDRLQGDADLEPVLGAPDVVGGLFNLQNLNQEDWARGGDCGEREPMADDEPPLGGLGDSHHQINWEFGGTDLEDEHDGREPEEDEHNLGRSEAIDQSRPEPGADDLEPSLGSIGGYSASLPQTLWAQGDVTGYDPEWQCEDEAAQCDDEGADSDMEGHGQAPCYAGPTCPLVFAP